MAEYVEMIDKYLVTRDESNRPSYNWTGHTGVIVRCRYCENWDLSDSFGWSKLGNFRCRCDEWSTEINSVDPNAKIYTSPDDYCSRGIKREVVMPNDRSTERLSENQSNDTKPR